MMNPLLPKDLSIFQWNCRGVLNKREVLVDHLGSFDIFTFSEIWLTPERKLLFKNHHILRRDGTSNHSGGVLIAVRRNIAFRKIESIPSFPGILETIGVEVPAVPKPLIIISVYKHPGPSDPLLWENFFSSFNCFSSAHIIITGDFNAHHISWGCHHSDCTGKLLLESSQEHHFFLLTTALLLVSLILEIFRLLLISLLSPLLQLCLHPGNHLKTPWAAITSLPSSVSIYQLKRFPPTLTNLVFQDLIGRHINLFLSL